MSTPYLTKIKANIAAEIKRLSADLLIETNAGTFSADECCRAVGSGDPAHGNYRIYETLAGNRRIVGCDPKDAPGYARRFTHQSPAQRRNEVKRLTALLAKVDKLPSWEPVPREILAFEFPANA